MMKAGNFMGSSFKTYCLFLLVGLFSFTACDDDSGDRVIVDPAGSMNVSDQNINNGTIIISQLVLDQDGWVVIHRATPEGGPVVPDIISEPTFVQDGTQTNVVATLKEGESVAVGEEVFVMLHTDTGQEAVYEFNGGDTPDQPILDSSGNIVMVGVTNIGPAASVTVSDQFIEETNNMILVDEVMFEEGGWVVVHRTTAEGGPVVPDIITVPKYLEAGTYTDVELMLQEGEELALGEQFFVMLHDDTDDDEEYGFTGAEGSPDIPLRDADLNIVMESAINNYTFTDDTENEVFPLVEVNGSGIWGTATFYRALNDDGAYVVLDVEGTPAGGNHPAHIHEGLAGSGGDISIPLENVDGDEGRSVTYVSSRTYEALLAYNGYINIHLSPEDLSVVSTGNIGANGSALTGESKQYTLGERAVPGINGTATFWQLEDGSALVQLMLEGTPEGGMHPAHIHVNSAVEGGGIAISLDPVNGTSGQSFTFVDMFDADSPDRAGQAVTYAELLDYDGYINVHLSAQDLGTIVAQGDIGGNELTGESTEYALVSAEEATDVNGTVTFNERKNGNTLVVIDVENTVPGIMHPAHIHEGLSGSGGPIAISLNSVDGTSGMSRTNVRAFDEGFNEGAAISYSGLLGYNGYVNVHFSPEDLRVVSTGNIGANAE